MTLYLDLSALQSVPAANLNRDDLGSPKQVRYGNALRIRVSSQSWKRVIRHGVEQDLGEKAARTRMVPVKVRHALERAGWPADLATFAGAQVAASAGKKGIGTEKAGHTSVLLFLPEAAIDELATVCTEHREALEAAHGKKNPGQILPPSTVEEILKRRTASISLLGRMLAELPDANVDGAAQVAHAFTTHAAEPQRYKRSSPPSRGCSGRLGDGRSGRTVLPAVAGVFRRPVRRIQRRLRPPRRRGGVPLDNSALVTSLSSSPPSRGCSGGVESASARRCRCRSLDHPARPARLVHPDRPERPGCLGGLAARAPLVRREQSGRRARWARRVPRGRRGLRVRLALRGRRARRATRATGDRRGQQARRVRHARTGTPFRRRRGIRTRWSAAETAPRTRRPATTPGTGRARRPWIRSAASTGRPRAALSAARGRGRVQCWYQPLDPRSPCVERIHRVAREGGQWIGGPEPMGDGPP
ncbi:type I-E CRISPR-associated protein Cas7/Cse4/CasC [Streptomyces griseofuscus]